MECRQVARLLRGCSTCRVRLGRRRGVRRRRPRRRASRARLAARRREATASRGRTGLARRQSSRCCGSSSCSGYRTPPPIHGAWRTWCVDRRQPLLVCPSAGAGLLRRATEHRLPPRFTGVVGRPTGPRRLPGAELGRCPFAVFTCYPGPALRALAKWAWSVSDVTTTTLSGPRMNRSSPATFAPPGMPQVPPCWLAPARFCSNTSPAMRVSP